MYKAIFRIHKNGPIESCNKRTTLQRNYWKMTISWSFSYNSFGKSNGKKPVIIVSRYDLPNKTTAIDMANLWAEADHIGFTLIHLKLMFIMTLHLGVKYRHALKSIKHYRDQTCFSMH